MTHSYSITPGDLCPQTHLQKMTVLKSGLQRMKSELVLILKVCICTRIEGQACGSACSDYRVRYTRKIKPCPASRTFHMFIK